MSMFTIQTVLASYISRHLAGQAQGYQHPHGQRAQGLRLMPLSLCFHETPLRVMISFSVGLEAREGNQRALGHPAELLQAVGGVSGFLRDHP